MKHIDYFLIDDLSNFDERRKLKNHKVSKKEVIEVISESCDFALLEILYDKANYPDLVIEETKKELASRDVFKY